MKVARFFVKSVFYIMLGLSVMVFGLLIYMNKSFENEYKIKIGDTFIVETFMPVTAEYKGVKVSCENLNTVGEEYDVDLKLFGLIPVSKVNVQVVDEMHVAVLGTPFGMKIYTEGVLVTDMTDVKTENGTKNPAKQAGIKKGDYIVSVNGENVYTNEDLSDKVRKSEGKKMDFLISRNNTKIHIYLTAVKSADDGEYKIGIWIKDSSAGIGTLTFYSPATNVVCGLGHGICEEDSDKLLQINSGEIVSAEITDVKKGKSGAPGQLEGTLNYTSIGTIDLNSNLGVYSKYKGNIDISNLTEIALKHDVTNGDGEILCTVDGETPKLYSCKITVRKLNFLSKTQNMVITITDERLLSKTGGIVQGMSGSPIIQNGKLVGAVTHVLIDEPTKGYAIFAENMLETAQGVAEQQLKEVS